MTEIVVGFLLAVAAPKMVAAIRRAWEAAAPQERPEVARQLSAEEIIEAVKGLPADPDTLGRLAAALQELRGRLEPPQKK